MVDSVGPDKVSSLAIYLIIVTRTRSCSIGRNFSNESVLKTKVLPSPHVRRITQTSASHSAPYLFALLNKVFRSLYFCWLLARGLSDLRDFAAV